MDLKFNVYLFFFMNYEWLFLMKNKILRVIQRKRKQYQLILNLRSGNFFFGGGGREKNERLIHSLHESSRRLIEMYLSTFQASNKCYSNDTVVISKNITGSKDALLLLRILPYRCHVILMFKLWSQTNFIITHYKQ